MLLQKPFAAVFGAVTSILAMTSVAIADGSTKDAAPAPEAPKSPFTYSFNVGVTTDYVFRGYSQKREEPALQGGIDLTYAVRTDVSAYFGIWGSGVDFGPNADGSRIVGAELDVYGGIKPKWEKATFDLGVIWYTYPAANDGGSAVNQVFEQNYVELKLGVTGLLASFFPQIDKLTTSSTVFWSPEYQGKQGSVWTLESTASYELSKVWVFTPSISGTLGSQYGDLDHNNNASGFTLGNGKDSLYYWNAGFTLSVEKLSFDFRYWDTNVKNNNLADGGQNNWCKGAVLQCDERFVFTAKYTY